MVTDWIMVGVTFIYVVATIWISISNRQSADATKEQTDVLKQQLKHQVEQEKLKRAKEQLDYLVYNAFASIKSRNGEGRLCIDEIYDFEPIKKLNVTDADIDECVNRLLYEQKIRVFFKGENLAERQYRVAREVQ